MTTALIRLADLGQGLGIAWLENFARTRLRAMGWESSDRDGWYRAR